MYRVTSGHDTSRLSPPPRQVYRKQGLSIPVRCLIYLLIPHVWVGVYLAWIFAGSCALALFGQERAATVTGRQYAFRSKKRDLTDCQIDYAYRDQGGRQADRVILDKSAYAFYPPGATIPIRSARILDHSISEPRSRAGPLNSFWGFAIFVIMWEGIVVGIFYLWCLSPLIQWWLVRYGQAVTGQITDKNEILIREFRGRRYVAYGISYSYPGPDGAEQMHKKRVDRVDYVMANAGQKLQVFYNPRRPRQHVLYQYSNYALLEWKR